MIKNDIFEKQNEKHMLDILYAQRHYYNIANILDNINILLTFFLCVFDFLEINNPIIKLLVNGVCGVIIFIITHIIKDCVKKGADLKKYFDYKLYAFEGITKQIQHNGVKGSAREDLLKALNDSNIIDKLENGIKNLSEKMKEAY